MHSRYGFPPVSPNPPADFGSRAATQSGITLLELLVALFIFSLISGLAFTSLYQIRQAHDSIHTTMKRVNEIRVALTLLEQDLHYAVPRMIRGLTDSVEPAFRGSSAFTQTQMEWSRASPTVTPSPQTAGLKRVQYFVRDKVLYRAVWTHIDRTAEATAVEQAVLSQVDQWRLIFHGPQNQVFELWPPLPNNPHLVPNAVDIELQLADFGTLRRLIVIKGYGP